jgi:hypothetical protein
VILVLCGAGDASARAVHAHLRAHGHAALLADAAALDTAPQSVRIGVADDAALALPGLPVLRPASVRAVLNRCPYPVAPPGPDAAYIAEERFAARLALLGSFRCVNAPSPSGLSGTERAVPVLRHLAALAGLPAAPWRAGEEGGQPAATALVAGGAVFGLPLALHGAARALAGFLDLALMGLVLDPAGQVLAATPLPDLAQAGTAGLDAVAERLLA